MIVSQTVDWRYGSLPLHRTLKLTLCVKNIFLSNPEDGSYHVMVHLFSGSSDTGSEVTINTERSAQAIPFVGFPESDWLLIARIDWPSGLITPFSADGNAIDGGNTVCPNTFSFSGIALADRRVDNLAGVYHYSLQLWSDIQPYELRIQQRRTAVETDGGVLQEALELPEKYIAILLCCMHRSSLTNFTGRNHRRRNGGHIRGVEAWWGTVRLLEGGRGCYFTDTWSRHREGQ